MIKIKTVYEALKAKGYQNVEMYKDDAIRLSCIFHKDNNPSAFVKMSRDKQFYKCFSCKKKIPIPVFIKLLDVVPEPELPKEFRFKRIGKKFTDLTHNKDLGTLYDGIKLYNDSSDYRFHANVKRYLEKRLGSNFYVPDLMKIKFNTDNHSLVFKGVEDSITERFNSRARMRFKNYGEGSLFHHYTARVEDLIIVEGLFDYLKLVNFGYNACALMTANFSEHKLTQLMRLFKNRVYLFLDNDKAGIEGTKQAKKQLVEVGIPVIEIKWLLDVQYNEVKDAGDIKMSKELFEQILYENFTKQDKPRLLPKCTT